MNTVILGWGSLIWNPELLSFDKRRSWIKTGPILPIEFARISINGRLTLVISKDGSEVQTLYAHSTESTLEKAVQNLRAREGTTLKNIGYYDKSTDQFFPSDFEFKQNILDWINDKDIDVVIWTNLKENWKEKTQNRLEYLKKLDYKRKELAKEYILKTPEQIMTTLREQIANNLNWK